MSDLPDHNSSVPPTIYQSAPLNLGTTSIRLLSLERSASGKIKGHLQTFEVASCPSYVALSYTWGDPVPVRHIEIDGFQHPIRENLFNGINSIFDYMSKPHVKNRRDDETLRTLLGEMEEANFGERTYDRATTAQSAGDGLNGITLQYIWIDSICIDQDNITEKNHQVNLMKDIFSNAHFVIAWLGLGSEYTIRAMNTFREYRNMGRYKPRWFYDRACFILQYDTDRRDMGLVIALSDFLNLEYFTRLWIIQELVLARRTVAMCGTGTIDMRLIREVVNLMPTITYASPAGGIFLDKSFDDFSELIHTYCGAPCIRKCTDPRDKVYGLLGISSVWNIPFGPYVNNLGELTFEFERQVTRQRLKNGSKATWNIIPNYKISPFELFLELLQRHIGALFDDMFEILEIPDDLRIIFDDNGAKVNPLPDGHRALFPVLSPNTSSREYLRLVRSLDWSAVDKWALNYRLLGKFSDSLPERSSMLIKHMGIYISPWGDNGFFKWAYLTLE